MSFSRFVSLISSCPDRPSSTVRLEVTVASRALNVAGFRIVLIFLIADARKRR